MKIYWLWVLLFLTGSGAWAQTGGVPDTLVSIPYIVDSLAAPFPFVDIDTNGVNDYYEQFAAKYPLLLQEQPYLYIQYKYRNGIGYGYGFVDFNRNGINDVFDQYPHLRDMQTGTYSSRSGSMDEVKQAFIRHGFISQDQTSSGQTDGNHFLHDGHCKDPSIYNDYMGTSPTQRP